MKPYILSYITICVFSCDFLNENAQQLDHPIHHSCQKHQVLLPFSHLNLSVELTVDNSLLNVVTSSSLWRWWMCSSASHLANASVLMFPKGRKTLGPVAAPMATIRHRIKCVQYNQNLQELERINISLQHPVLYIHCGVLTPEGQHL